MPEIEFDFSVVISATDVSAVLLDGSTNPVLIALPSTNAGMHVADVTVTTHSGNDYTVPLELVGTDAASFALTNGGVVPCELTVGASDLPTGAYSLGIKAPA